MGMVTYRRLFNVGRGEPGIEYRAGNREQGRGNEDYTGRAAYHQQRPAVYFCTFEFVLYVDEEYAQCCGCSGKRSALGEPKKYSSSLIDQASSLSAA